MNAASLWKGRRLSTLLLAASLLGSAGCGVRAAVSMKLRPVQEAPLDASVTIDEQFIGLLGYVASRGVRLPEGRHRITVERNGYFPWDRVVVSDRKPIHLEVRMTKIPD